MIGWSERLWLPMEAPRLLVSEKPMALDVKTLAAGCVYDPSARHSFLQEDPMMLGNRFSVGRLAPHRKFEPELAHTIKESDFLGQMVWSNKVEAIKHYEAAARNLAVIGETVHCHAHAPCWAVATGENATTFLSVPSYIVTDDKDVYPMCGTYAMRSLETFGLLDFERVAEKSSQIPLRGEVITFDPSYVERDELAWRLYPRLWILRVQGNKFFEWLSPEGVHSLKCLTDLWRQTDFHDLTPITRNRQELISHVALLANEIRRRPMPAVRLGYRDSVLPQLEDVLELSRRLEMTPAPELSPNEADALAAMAPM